jgi:putative SOS response-associated peptidase YedK
MSGCFAQHYTWKQIHDAYGLTGRKPPVDIRPRYRIRPGATIDTVRLVKGRRIFEPMRWGLVPNWWLMGTEPTNPATFNTHIDTAESISFFRDSLGRRHCLIPASGYYEWQDTPDGKQPYYFTRRDGSVMTLAGLWDEWRHPDTNELVLSSTMMIVEPNKFVAEVRDRMPAILEPSQFEGWLSGASVRTSLKPAAENVLDRHPVSKRLTRSRTSDADATLIEKVTLPEHNSSLRVAELHWPEQ